MPRKIRFTRVKGNAHATKSDVWLIVGLLFLLLSDGRAILTVAAIGLFILSVIG